MPANATADLVRVKEARHSTANRWRSCRFLATLTYVHQNTRGVRFARSAKRGLPILLDPAGQQAENVAWSAVLKSAGNAEGVVNEIQPHTGRRGTNLCTRRRARRSPLGCCTLPKSESSRVLISRRSERSNASHWAFFEFTKRDYKKIPIEEQVELMSLVGNIALDDKGAPKLHAHVVVGKSDGTAHGGHLLEAYVRPTLEVIVIESSRNLRRKMRAEFGIALLDLA
jgi:hypothetical protein